MRKFPPPRLRGHFSVTLCYAAIRKANPQLCVIGAPLIHISLKRRLFALLVDRTAFSCVERSHPYATRRPRRHRYRWYAFHSVILYKSARVGDLQRGLCRLVLCCSAIPDKPMANRDSNTGRGFGQLVRFKVQHSDTCCVHTTVLGHDRRQSEKSSPDHVFQRVCLGTQLLQSLSPPQTTPQPIHHCLFMSSAKPGWDIYNK